MSKFRELHNKFMTPTPKYTQKDVPCPTLVDELKPLFLDMD